MISKVTSRVAWLNINKYTLESVSVKASGFLDSLLLKQTAQKTGVDISSRP